MCAGMLCFTYSIESAFMFYGERLFDFVVVYSFLLCVTYIFVKFSRFQCRDGICVVHHIFPGLYFASYEVKSSAFGKTKLHSIIISVDFGKFQ